MSESSSRGVSKFGSGPRTRVLREGQDARRAADLELARVVALQRPRDGVPVVVVFGGEGVDVARHPREVVLDLRVVGHRVLIDVWPLVDVGDGHRVGNLPGIRAVGRLDDDVVDVVRVSVIGILVVDRVLEGDKNTLNGGRGRDCVDYDLKVARVGAAQAPGDRVFLLVGRCKSLDEEIAGLSGCVVGEFFQAACRGVACGMYGNQRRLVYVGDGHGDGARRAVRAVGRLHGDLVGVIRPVVLRVLEVRALPAEGGAVEGQHEVAVGVFLGLEEARVGAAQRPGDVVAVAVGGGVGGHLEVGRVIVVLDLREVLRRRPGDHGRLVVVGDGDHEVGDGGRCWSP